MAKLERDPLLEALQDYNTYKEPEIIKLKSKVLNGILNGGVPVGSVIQFAAESGVGKSTIALDISRELLEQGKNVLYIDAEKGLNPSNLSGTGVLPYVVGQGRKNTKGKMMILKEYDVGRIHQALRKLFNDKTNRKNRLVDCIVLDSLGSLSAGLYDDDKADMNVRKVGGITGNLRQLMIYFNGVAIDYDITFIIINHTQKDIGSFFPTEHAVGGSTPKYLSDVLIQLTRSGKPITNSKNVPIAQKVNCEAVKSRLGAGRVKKAFYIALGKGISNLYTYCDILQEIDVVVDGVKKKMLTITPGSSSNHLYLNGKDIAFRGKDNIINVIKENYLEIDKLIDDSYFRIVNSDDEDSPVLNNISSTDTDELDLDYEDEDLDYDEDVLDLDQELED